ncbi:hypothetical protein JYU34_002697 [Plutella xylostella]|uniref:Uncharacterized protein n=1 Tax=Plutella xylostella TaxID=51655 RepID=A0ABQ7R2X6_PLUXY|nr:hypothetical protein JYU34_002697 [Plutella xylostella]
MRNGKRNSELQLESPDGEDGHCEFVRTINRRRIVSSPAVEPRVWPAVPPPPPPPPRLAPPPGSWPVNV